MDSEKAGVICTALVALVLIAAIGGCTYTVSNAQNIRAERAKLCIDRGLSYRDGECVK